MQEIRAIPWNGLRVASTFSGCGGSCLGYTMAGYKVVWANEFVPIAQDSYRANFPNTTLDPRDVKLVQASDILTACGLGVGDLDLFDGSPPCQAFSTSSQREKGWGKPKKYEHGVSQNNEDLFFQYVRLVRDLQPKTFVAENVRGLTIGTSIGYFKQIIAELRSCGYIVEARVLDAKYLGVPQSRTRCFFVGIRNDVADKGYTPCFPSPFSYTYSIADAIPALRGGILKIREFGGGKFSNPKSKKLQLDCDNRARPIIKAKGIDSAFIGEHEIELNRRARPTIQAKGIGGVFLSQYSIVDPQPPRIDKFAIGKEARKLLPGQASKKFFNLCRPDVAKPCPAICASHGRPAIASPIHPAENRKFSIAEIKAITSFPKDFVLKGSFAQQWERVGNSVPPFMSKAVAEAIAQKILLPLRASSK